MSDGVNRCHVEGGKIASKTKCEGKTKNLAHRLQSSESSDILGDIVGQCQSLKKTSSFRNSQICTEVKGNSLWGPESRPASLSTDPCFVFPALPFSSLPPSLKQTLKVRSQQALTGVF